MHVQKRYLFYKIKFIEVICIYIHVYEIYFFNIDGAYQIKFSVKN